MARDSAGAYTLPTGNPVSADTPISSTWANATLDDFKAEMTDSLSRSGEGSMIAAALQVMDGTAVSPSIILTGDLDAGLYGSPAGVGLVIGGVAVLHIDGAGGTSFIRTPLGPTSAAGAVGLRVATTGNPASPSTVSLFELRKGTEAAGTTMLGVDGLGAVWGEALRLDPSVSGIAQPTAADGLRGLLWFVRAAAGGSDTLKVCVNVTGAPAWKNVVLSG